MSAESMTRLLLVLSLAGSPLPFADRARAAEGEGPKRQTADAAVARIDVSFKLDPRLTRSMYMGDRWVSPPTYTRVGTGQTVTVEARARGLDAGGKPVGIRPEWTPSDPVMVTVAPTEGSEVTLTVQRAGETRVQVAAGGVSKELAIKAVDRHGALQVDITQHSPASARIAEVPEQAAGVLFGQKEKTSYALGMDLGHRLRRQSVDVDIDLLSRGLKDTLAGEETLLTEAEASAVLLALRNELKTKTTADLGEKNRKEGETFLADNKKREGVVTLDSGLQYKVLAAGDGAKPTADDRVVCHYRGTLIDGSEFDSSYRRGKPATVAIKRVIKGWREALQLMPVGSKWQLFVPPELTHGVRGTPRIPPNVTLVFEVELLSIGEKPQTTRQTKSASKKLAEDKSVTP